MRYLSFIFNILIVALIVRLCSKNNSEFFFNPFVSYVNARINRVLAFLKPILALPEQASLIILIIFIFLFKTMLLSRLDYNTGIKFGQYITCRPSGNISEQSAIMVFSFLSTMLFIFKLWSFYILVSLVAAPKRRGRAGDALCFFTRPFSSLPMIFQPFVLLGVHAATAFLASLVGFFSYTPEGTAKIVPLSLNASSFLVHSIKMVWMGMLSLSDGLMMMVTVLFGCIIGSVIAALMKKRSVMTLCQEGVALVLGRFYRGGATGAGLDFTPIIFYFAVSIGYKMISSFVTGLISMPIQLPF